MEQNLYDIFLSHHTNDKPQVEWLAARLEDEAGLKPFLDKWHLVPGQAWQEDLETALSQSASCAVFLGPNGLGVWENEEMRLALDDRVRNKEFRVIPVLLPGAAPKDAATLPRFLRRLTWVDFHAGLDDPEAFQRLVAGIRGHAPGRLGSPSSVPVTPRKYGKWIVGAVAALLTIAVFVIVTIPQNHTQTPATTAKPASETATLSGIILDQAEQPIQGAQVTIDEMPGMEPVETSNLGVFIITEIPKSYREMVRIRVSKEGHQTFTQDVVIGASPPRVVLRRKK